MERILSFFRLKDKEIKEYEIFDTFNEYENAKKITDWDEQQVKIAEVRELSHRYSYERSKDCGYFAIQRKDQLEEFLKIPKEEREKIIKKKKND